MSIPIHDAKFWKKARLARDKLVKQYLDHPDVSLIDIGYAPEQGTGTEAIVLRIHVREELMTAKEGERITFPAQIDGIPVVVIPGDYRLAMS